MIDAYQRTPLVRTPLALLVPVLSVLSALSVLSGCKDGASSSKQGSSTAQASNPCAGKDGCRDQGKCTSQDGVCVVGGDADCANNSPCSEEGRCVAYKAKNAGGEMKCGAISDAKCEAGAQTSQAGRVFARSGASAPLTEPCTAELARTVGCSCVTEAGKFR